ncbi:aminotransferase class I and II family protein [Collimonas arenae]|nr:aminotransferase class I and II family protein [Collimonas arenae]
MTQNSSPGFYAHIRDELTAIQAAGLMKSERLILGPQGGKIDTENGELINLCANNYLGLSSHPALIKAAHAALDTHGFGMSSVRFICGTQDIHRELEQRLSTFLGTEDCILYAAAFDANGGLFEPLLGEQDAIISDSLNHASIIDGIRLCKAKRYRYAHNDMADLERCLKEARPITHALRWCLPTACFRWMVRSRNSAKSASCATSTTHCSALTIATLPVSWGNAVVARTKRAAFSARSMSSPVRSARPWAAPAAASQPASAK